MSDNSNLHRAKRAKNDEFYTQYEDIEKEMVHYIKHFAGKTIYCNCDDPTWSNFWKFFHEHFSEYQLKKLISTHYEKDGSPSYATIYEGGDDSKIDDYQRIDLKENGDFRSEECVKFLEESDIVATNPPFSLFREYIHQLMEYKKKFVIIGNLNAITYKEIFPYIKNNELWIGVTIHSGDRKFYVPDDYPLNAYGCGIDEFKKKYIRVKGVRWFTNLKIQGSQKILELIQFFSEDKYLYYADHDAININKTADIPRDYNGVMGVPISFIDYYNDAQFKILACCEPCIDIKAYRKDICFKEYKSRQLLYNGNLCQKTYHRLLIKKIV